MRIERSVSDSSHAFSSSVWKPTLPSASITSCLAKGLSGATSSAKSICNCPCDFSPTATRNVTPRRLATTLAMLAGSAFVSLNHAASASFFCTSFVLRTSVKSMANSICTRSLTCGSADCRYSLSSGRVLRRANEIQRDKNCRSAGRTAANSRSSSSTNATPSGVKAVLTPFT